MPGPHRLSRLLTRLPAARFSFDNPFRFPFSPLGRSQMGPLLSFGKSLAWKNELAQDIGVLRPSMKYEGSAASELGQKLKIIVRSGDGESAIQKIVEFQRKGWESGLSDQVQINVLSNSDQRLEDVKKGLGEKGRSFEYLRVDGTTLPFPDETFDLYVTVFDLIHEKDVKGALKEAFRVLKQGGRILTLEFSKVNDERFGRLYKMYAQNMIPVLGKVLAQNESEYKELVENIDRFYSQEELVNVLEDAGFSYCRYRNLDGGVAAIHSGFKLSKPI